MAKTYKLRARWRHRVVPMHHHHHIIVQSKFDCVVCSCSSIVFLSNNFFFSLDVLLRFCCVLSVPLRFDPNTLKIALTSSMSSSLRTIRCEFQHECGAGQTRTAHIPWFFFLIGFSLHRSSIFHRVFSHIFFYFFIFSILSSSSSFTSSLLTL